MGTTAKNDHCTPGLPWFPWPSGFPGPSLWLFLPFSGALGLLCGSSGFPGPSGFLLASLVILASLVFFTDYMNKINYTVNGKYDMALCGEIQLELPVITLTITSTATLTSNCAASLWYGIL